jgi:hypothetical protein
MDSKIDYTIRIPVKQTAERIGCQWCKHSNSCQYHVEIFEEHWKGWRNEINHRTKTEIIGTLCKHFEK